VKQVKTIQYAGRHIIIHIFGWGSPLRRCRNAACTVEKAYSYTPCLRLKRHWSQIIHNKPKRNKTKQNKNKKLYTENSFLFLYFVYGDNIRNAHTPVTQTKEKTHTHRLTPRI